MSFLAKLFGGGIPHIDAAAVNAKRAEKPGPFLLDVREPSEFSEGHIPGAQLIPLGQLAQKMNTLSREREIICICRSGSRSGSAARQLASAGFTALNMNGGMSAWERAGLPIKKGVK